MYPIKCGLVYEFKMEINLSSISSFQFQFIIRNLVKSQCTSLIINYILKCLSIPMVTNKEKNNKKVILSDQIRAQGK